jgi:hypothetical protein
VLALQLGHRARLEQHARHDLFITGQLVAHDLDRDRGV